MWLLGYIGAGYTVRAGIWLSVNSHCPDCPDATLVVLSDEGAVATKDTEDGWRSAVCGGHEMRRGRHCATFTLRSLDGGAAILGVVGVGFDPTSSGRAYASSEGWMLCTSWTQLAAT